MLPSGDTVWFRDSTFFTMGNARLPSPADVRLAAGSEKNPNRPTPVVFPSLKLIVKYGQAIEVAEGQCLWAIRRLLPAVPVPEVYGWCREDEQTFIYMELIDGITLEQAWPDLDVEEKYEICIQLHQILGNLRQLRQDPATPFVGKVLANSQLGVFLTNIRRKY